MVSVKALFAAGAAVTISTAAWAADLGMPPPYPPPAVVGGWYLRGDIGVGMTDSTFQYLPNPLNTVDVINQTYSNADTLFFGGGIGYELNNWLRFDVTGEYRSRTNLNADIFYGFGGGTFGDQYQGYLRSAVVLANAYVDLGTWWCITPFIGAGVGGAYNMVDLVDTSIATLTGGAAGGTGSSASWSPAWALYAGLDYNVTPNFIVELSYRYLNYGSVTDTIYCFGGCNPDSYRFDHLTSQDIMLGVRWLLVPELLAPPPLTARD